MGQSTYTRKGLFFVYVYNPFSKERPTGLIIFVYVFVFFFDLAGHRLIDLIPPQRAAHPGMRVT